MDLAQLSRIHAQKEANAQANQDAPAPPAEGTSEVSKLRLGMASNLALIALATGQFDDGVHGGRRRLSGARGRTR